MSGFDQVEMVEQAALEAEKTNELSTVEDDFQSLYEMTKAKNTDERIQKLRNEIMKLEKELAVISETYEAAIFDYQERIRNAVLLQEMSVKGQFGKATFRHGPTSTKWDDEALLKYAKEHEDFEKMVKYFRTESIGKASVSISIGDQKC